MARVYRRSRTPFLCIAAVCSIVVAALMPLAAQDRALGTRSSELTPVSNIVVIPPGSAYKQTNLVSDAGGIALLSDPLLVNPWGMAFTPTDPFWIANNGTSTATLYAVSPVTNAVIFTGPPRVFTVPGGLPTGIVSNGTSDFVVTSGASGPAQFIFSSITGNIAGWKSNVPAVGSTTAVIAASNPGHVYTGLALANNGTGNFLYAADFANGKIDVFNNVYTLQQSASFPFTDATIPTTYHPHNIQAIGGQLYVTYAKVGVDGREETGIGNGFVRRFNTSGVKDLGFAISNGPLNAPWGIVIAPASFGIFGSALLVGNFGEGNPSIHAFNPTTGAFLGTLQDEAGDGIAIDELWALSFGNGGTGGDPNTLYFSAGIGAEEHGLFGSLKPTTASATALIQFSADSYVVGENSGMATISVTRAGDVSGSATINYAALNESQPGHATLGTPFIEGSPAQREDSSASAPDESLQRRPGGTAGSTQDTGNNAADFQLLSPSNPQNLASAVTPPSGTSPASTGVVISEFRNYGPGGTFGNQFIELYNNTNAPVDISGWKVKSDFFGGAAVVLTVNTGTIIPARGHFLATRAPNYTGSVPGDQTFGTSFFVGGIALTKADDTIVDQLAEEVCAGCGAQDMALPPGKLTFAPGETSKTFQIAIRPDAFVEGEEIMKLVLSNPTGTTTGLGQPNIAILHILDATGSAPPVPSISINDVALNEGTFGTTNFVFTLTRSGTSALSQTVAYNVAPDTATSPSDFPAQSGMVTFQPNDTSKTITIRVNGDSAIEPSETFFVNLSNTGNATIADPQGVGTIINDDPSSDTAMAARGDFNGDGKTDILLHNTTTGDIGMWFMNGFGILGSGFTGTLSFTNAIAGVGDFNGDGKSDILLRDDLGNIGMWLMNGSVISSGALVGTPGGTYTVAAVADFDGDGKADILLRDSLGTIGMWIMNGPVITSGALIGSPGGSYVVVAAADFDGNGKADVLLRDSGGNLGMWLMNGPVIAGGGLVGSLGAYTVAGAADYNGDGKADILLRDASGNLGLWFMNGATISGGASVGAPAGFTVAGVGNYNGDTHADILLRNATTGDVGMWLMNGATVTSGGLVGPLDLSFEIR